MPQPIVPLGTPKARRFEKQESNQLLLKLKIERIEFSFYQALAPEQLASLVEKVLAYDHSAE